MPTIEPDGDLRRLLDNLDFPPIEEGPVGVKALTNVKLVTEYNRINRRILQDDDFYQKVEAGDPDANDLLSRHDALLVELHIRGMR